MTVFLSILKGNPSHIPFNLKGNGNKAFSVQGALLIMSPLCRETLHCYIAIRFSLLMGIRGAFNCSPIIPKDTTLLHCHKIFCIGGFKGPIMSKDYYFLMLHCHKIFLIGGLKGAR